MDKKNEVKLTMMFDGGGTVEGADLNGCWNTCHNDLRSMKDAKDDKKTKYTKGGDLAGGKFMDLIQYRSGKGEKPVDGYVTDKRYMEGGKGLVKAEGIKEGNKWVVTFERTWPAAARVTMRSPLTRSTTSVSPSTRTSPKRVTTMSRWVTNSVSTKPWKA